MRYIMPRCYTSGKKNDNVAVGLRIQLDAEKNGDLASSNNRPSAHSQNHNSKVTRVLYNRNPKRKFTLQSTDFIVFST